jgi:hypothetical protein
MRDDHAELRRDDVEPLRRLLADHMHRRSAAGAVGIFGRNPHVDVRQVGRKCATIGPALISALACARRVLPVLSRLVAGKGLLDVLDRQQQLFRIELLRAAAELRVAAAARGGAADPSATAHGRARRSQRRTLRSQRRAPRASLPPPISLLIVVELRAAASVPGPALRSSVTTGTKSGASSAGRLSTPARAGRSV